MKSSWPSDVTDVQYRYRGYGYRGYRGYGYGGSAIGAGVALGVLGIIAGAAAAQSNPYYYQPGYYGSGYYEPGYPAPIYRAPPVIYAPAPVYVAPQPHPGYGPRQCWITTDQDRGFGYWTPC